MEERWRRAKGKFSLYSLCYLWRTESNRYQLEIFVELGKKDLSGLICQYEFGTVGLLQVRFVDDAVVKCKTNI